MAKTRRPPLALAAPAPDPGDGRLTTSKPWLLAGIGRATYYRLMGAEKAPLPIDVPGRSNQWRIADIARWIADRPPARPRPAPRRKTKGD
jgi:predicted DNA-binding transcriptional regulator AlpA